MKNYYDILGVQQTASVKTINEAYKKLAFKFHPDKNAGDEFYAKWFTEINEANKILSDKEERESYDFNLKMHEDAYETLKIQHEEEQLKTSDRRRAYKQRQKSGKLLWVAAILGVVVFCIIFFINDNKSSAVGIEPLFKIHTQEYAAENGTPGNDKDDLAVEHTALTSSKAVDPQPAANNEAPLLRNRENSAIVNNKKKTATGRQLNEAEIHTILEQLSGRNKMKGVRIVQSYESNINKDFAIAGILQNHGYSIAGRDILYKSALGISVIEERDCVSVIIGRLAAK